MQQSQCNAFILKSLPCEWVCVCVCEREMSLKGEGSCRGTALCAHSAAPMWADRIQWLLLSHPHLSFCFILKWNFLKGIYTFVELNMHILSPGWEYWWKGWNEAGWPLVRGADEDASSSRGVKDASFAAGYRVFVVVVAHSEYLQSSFINHEECMMLKFWSTSSPGHTSEDIFRWETSKVTFKLWSGD